MRAPLLLASFLLALHGYAFAVTVHSVVTVPPQPSAQTDTLPELSRAELTRAELTRAELTRAERRELRQLEREDRRARQRFGSADADPSDTRNPFAIASLATAGGMLAVLMVAAFTVGPPALFWISLAAFSAAVVFGIIGMKRARRRGLRQRGLAVAGFITGVSILAVYFIGLVAFFIQVTSGGF